VTENYNWRWVFYINVPFGISHSSAFEFFLPERRSASPRFDFFGFTALSVGVAAFQITVYRGAN